MPSDNTFEKIQKATVTLLRKGGQGVLVLSHLIQNIVFSTKPSTIQNHKPLIFNKTFFD
jgi:hypothetical protein